MTKRVNTPARKSHVKTEQTEKAIIKIIRSSKGAPIRLRELAGQLGYSQSNAGQVSRLISSMIKSGLIEKTGSFRYKVVRNTSAKKAESTNDMEYPAYVSATNTLVFEFIRNTRSVNVLDFLGWIESRG